MCTRIPCEQDLKSENLNHYGLAAARCQNPSQDCLAEGFCHYGGHCFENKAWTHEEAVAHIQTLERLLQESEVKYNQLHAHHLHLISMLKTSIKRALEQSKDTSAFALRQCLSILEKV